MEQSSGAYKSILPRRTIGVSPGISVLPRRRPSTLLRAGVTKKAESSAVKIRVGMHAKSDSPRSAEKPFLTHLPGMDCRLTTQRIDLGRWAQKRGRPGTWQNRRKDAQETSALIEWAKAWRRVGSSPSRQSKKCWGELPCRSVLRRWGARRAAMSTSLRAPARCFSPRKNRRKGWGLSAWRHHCATI